MVRFWRGLVALIVGFSFAFNLRKAAGLRAPSVFGLVLTPLIGLAAYAALQRLNGEQFKRGWWWVIVWYAVFLVALQVLFDWLGLILRGGGVPRFL
jgi:hypothetical protein